MPRPRKAKRPKRRPRGAGSISYCARLELWEARFTVKIGRSGDAERALGESRDEIFGIVSGLNRQPGTH